MLAVAVCAVLAGARTFTAITDWVTDLDQPAWGRLGLGDRLPAATTLWRLLIRIDDATLSAVLARWLRSRAKPVVAGGRRWRLVIAIDGKVVRGARLDDGRQVHLLSAYDTVTGIVLAQSQIDYAMTLRRGPVRRLAASLSLLATTAIRTTRLTSRSWSSGCVRGRCSGWAGMRSTWQPVS